MAMISGYSDQLRETMRQCGLSVNPVVERAGQAALKFDAIDITDDRLTFLWLGKPVYMVKRNQEQLVHMWGELPLVH
jgi:hypothetical protein